MAVKIIYEDKDILVCEKPAGLAVQSARISEPDMVSELKNYLTGKQPTGAPGKSAEISAFGGTRQPASATTSVGVRKPQSVYLGVVHRLDQPVSGLLVFAKNKKAAGALSTQTAQHQMNKIYYAVVYTKEDLTGKRGTLTDWLVKEASIARVCDASQNGAKRRLYPGNVWHVRETGHFWKWSWKREDSIRSGCRWRMRECRFLAISATAAKRVGRYPCSSGFGQSVCRQ